MSRQAVTAIVAVVIAIVVIIVIVDQATSPDGDPVAVIGDSITALGQDQLNATIGKDFKLTVNGQSGAKVSERQGEASALAVGKPTQVIINLGTNDVLQHVATADSAAGLQQMVQDFKAASCIHLVTINTRMHPANGNQTHDGAVAINNAIHNLAKANDNVDVIDWDAINADAVDSSHPNGLTFDGVHPTSAGQSDLDSAYDDALEDCGRPWRFW
jgi:lysophospholipase L1-like esterase